MRVQRLVGTLNRNKLQTYLDQPIFEIGDFTFRVANLVGVGIVILVTIVVLAVFKRIIEHPRFRGDESELRRRHSIFLLLKYFILVIAFVVGLEVLGIKVQILLAGSAALLVGIGLGLQSIFADFLSGIFLLIEGTMKVGEIIEVDGLVGRVEEINLRNSKVLSRENVVVIVPNSKFVTEKVVNWSLHNESIRFTVDVGVAYGSDTRKVKEILEETMLSNKAIDASPEPHVRFKDFGDSSLDFELIFWTKQAFTVDFLKSDLRFEIYDQLKKHGITIPFPQRDVHIKKEG